MRAPSLPLATAATRFDNYGLGVRPGLARQQRSNAGLKQGRVDIDLDMFAAGGIGKTLAPQIANVLAARSGHADIQRILRIIGMQDQYPRAGLGKQHIGYVLAHARHHILGFVKGYDLVGPAHLARLDLGKSLPL